MRDFKTSKFIEKAIAVHNDKYQYEQVTYINAKTKVSVGCKIHGYFEISPDNHLRKRGCPKCKGKGLSNEDFIKLANDIHDNKYDYSKSSFYKKSSPITIICKHHGVFQQLPSVHLKGHGCPKCAKKHVRTKKEIFEEANEIHNSKYQYLDLKSITQNGKTRRFLTIFCPTHNHKWESTIDSHLNKKNGCNYCGDEKSSVSQRGDLREIIKRINLIHPLYILDENQKYYNQHTNIKYACPEHGIQKGRPINLLSGQGCPVCGQESRNDFFRDDWEDVRKKIHSKHPMYHVYQEQPYLNHHTPIVFKCNIHGDKVSNANTLLSKGSGCDECGNIRRAESQKSDWASVISYIESIHENIKIVKDQKYVNTNSKIEYLCNKHGIHQATPSKLIQGRGCPECAKENHHGYSDSAWIKLCGSRVAKLYWIKMEHENVKWTKIGRTFMSIKERFWELNKIGINYEVIRVITGDPEYICKLERRMHKFYKKHQYIPTINFGGRTECFKILP